MDALHIDSGYQFLYCDFNLLWGRSPVEFQFHDAVAPEEQPVPVVGTGLKDLAKWARSKINRY